MKRPIFITIILFGLFVVVSFIVGACAPASDLPAEATKIAQTVVAGASTVQAAGETILTQPAPMTPTKEGVIDLTTVCVPPIGWEKLTELSLSNEMKVSAFHEWITLKNADGEMKGAVQTTDVKSTPFVDQGVNLEVILACNWVYYNPDSR